MAVQNDRFPAHIRTDRDTQIQTVQTVTEHLRNVAGLCQSRLSSIGLGQSGYLAGLLHDMGKFTDEFAGYIRKAVNGEPVRKGSVNHTFAGVRWLWKTYHASPDDPYAVITCELLALVVGAHHGQFDCYDENGASGFEHRLETPIPYDESVKNFFTYGTTEEEIDRLFRASVKEIRTFTENFQATLTSCKNACIETVWAFLYRLILSALIDADRCDTADFMGTPIPAVTATPEDWQHQRIFLEKKLEELRRSSPDTPINRARNAISDTAGQFGDQPEGLYRMTVPTGGGKTLASLRAALAHAETHRKQRIIFVIPLLSVLEQNARVIRDNLLPPDSPQAKSLPSPFLVEHHSNLINDKAEHDELNENELITENWHAPVIITTLVQLLNTLFDGRTSCIRRMQSLIDSVVVIDEVQTVPRKLLSLFNEAINFLIGSCHATVILSSATQPCFTEMTHPMVPAHEIIPYDQAQWDIFRRTEILDRTSPPHVPMTPENLAAFASEEAKRAGSLLIICNTKKEAAGLYRILCDFPSDTARCVFHLSTSMCMRHRMDTTARIRDTLNDHKPLICISTQLMEAGVDLSFGCVIRVMAGLDNLIQSAGRCNRNGESDDPLPVYCVEWAKENLSHLPDIQSSKNALRHLFTRAKKSPACADFLSETATTAYYKELFKEAKGGEYDYPLSALSTNLYELLTDNQAFVREKIVSCLRQAFKTAGQCFRVFDTDTTDILVPYSEEGEALIADFAGQRAARDLIYRKELLQRSRPYTLSLYQYQIQNLQEQNALVTLCDGAVFALRSGYYDDHLGLLTNQDMSALIL